MIKIYKMVFRIYWVLMLMAPIALSLYGVFSDIDGLALKLYLSWYLKVLLVSVVFSVFAVLLAAIRSNSS